MPRLKYPDRDLYICIGGLIFCFTNMERFWERVWTVLRTNTEVVIDDVSAFGFHWYRIHDPSTGVVSLVVSLPDRPQKQVPDTV